MSTNNSESLKEYAARYVEQAASRTSTYKEAAAWLEEKARRDKMLWRAITEPLLAKACYDAVRTSAHRERRAAWQATSPKQQSDRLVAAMVSLLDFRLVNGKRIADATKVEVIVSAEFYETQSRDMATKAIWLRRVAAEIGDEGTVGDALDEAALRRLRDED